MAGDCAIHDRNLLFGILAVQMDFISRDALIAAMNAWVLTKDRALGDILVAQRALAADSHDLLEALVRKHLAIHGGDAEKSLAAVSSVGAVQEELKQITDPDLQYSLAHVSVAPQAQRDRWVTAAPSVGVSTSAGTRFRILRPHAKGGLGQVSVAQDEELHREVALKEILDRHADNPESRARFVLEAEITGGLEHPGIVPVYGLGQYADGRPFYAMRFIRGDNLMDVAERFHQAEGPSRDATERALALRKLLRRIVDVCNVIAYAHSRGVLHRDLKPGNIVLGQYGETMVVDWGLAKPLDRSELADSTEGPLRPSSSSGSAPTQMGSAIGTPQYMSPEQAAGRLDLLGPASDVYSLGATLYCVLVGRAPFEGEDVGMVLQKVQRGDFPRPREVNRRVRKPLEVICLKAMALRPEDRYPSPAALADDIEHWLADEKVAAYREPWAEQLRRWARRHRTLVTSGAVLLLTAVTALSTGLVLLTRKQVEVVQQRNAAQLARDQAEKVTKFYEDHVLAAARPKGWSGGAGRGLTLKEALDQAAPKIDEAFAGQPQLAAAVHDTLGMTYWYLGQYAAANPHLEKAYALRLEALGPDHLDTLTSLEHLARQRWRQGKFKDAEMLERVAMETGRRVLGPEAQQTLWAQLNLGLFLLDEERLDEAESLLRDAIEACKRTLGPDHHHTLYGRNDLAAVLRRKGKLEEAVALDRQTLEGRRRALGPDDPDTLRSMANLATGLRRMGQYAEAEALARSSLEARRRVLGPEHIETLYGEEILGRVLVERGKRDEAEKLFREVLAAFRKTLPPDLDIADALADLGLELTDSGRSAQAEPLLRECLAIRKKKLPPGHWEIAAAQGLLGGCLARQNKFAEAETLLPAACEGLTAGKGPSAKQVAWTHDRIIELYEKWGKPDQVEAWKKKWLTSGKMESLVP